MDLAPLPSSFYDATLLRVARGLLGRRLVRQTSEGRVVGRLVEVEAYGGRLDPSAHSWRRRTERNATMFGPPGRAYVYLSYGTHWCLNVVAGERDLAGAVLLRAVELEEGLGLARERRARHCPGAGLRQRLREGRADRQLADGPGKLGVAFAVDHGLDGAELGSAADLWLAEGPGAPKVRWSPRVGLGAAASKDWCWRCVDARSTVVPTRPGPISSRPLPSLSEARRLRLHAPKATPASSRRELHEEDGVDSTAWR